MPLEFPVIYLLPNRLAADELHALEEQIPTLTYDVTEAEVLLGKVSRKERALFELRSRKLWTEEVSTESASASPRVKRRNILGSGQRPLESDSDTASDRDAVGKAAGLDRHPEITIKVVQLSWFTDSLNQGVVQPFGDCLVYEGRKVSGTSRPTTPAASSKDILSRARADTGGSQTSPSSKYGQGSPRRNRAHYNRPIKPPAIIQQTSSEHDIDLRLPPVPDFLHTTYSCQRSTPVHSPNEAFIDELKKIRRTRTLIGDKIGVRAYSSSIATLAAYPYSLSSAQEVTRLPGCGAKIAVLFQQFKESGHLQEVEDAKSDSKLSVLSTFYDIWGVAETTAREFYNQGWRDLDDVVEHGWANLSRVQQIGVKYYEELLLGVPRSEVEHICNVILEHANGIRKGFQMVIVGGYRRGKKESGDVDVILSHPEEEATHGFAEKIVISLEKDNHITHTLTLSAKNSERGQQPVSWKGNDRRAGAGFDTLDKAMVVWQNPEWTAKEGETRNPNPHRRVDIIISPWKTVGCAVVGWTGGTTFQRDLRRYCKKERSLKFDSSGIRSRADGAWVDLESGPDGPAPDMLAAERRVFAGLGLEWRSPEERCTG